MELADQCNQYIDQHKPWQLAKDPNNKQKVLAVSTMGLNLFRILIIYLKPIIPELAIKAEDFLKIAPLTWHDLDKPILDQEIKPFSPMIKRITDDDINALTAAAQKEIEITS